MKKESFADAVLLDENFMKCEPMIENLIYIYMNIRCSMSVSGFFTHMTANNDFNCWLVTQEEKPINIEYRKGQVNL